MRLIIILFFFMISSLEGSEEIVKRLRQWPRDFNDKNIHAVCDLFAQNLIASYPGTPDKNYEQMCRQLSLAIKDKEKKFRYEEPLIEEVIIEGDLAVVRLIWTLKIADQKEINTIREKGLDVFKRQKDGKWRIVISYAYPID